VKHRDPFCVPDGVFFLQKSYALDLHVVIHIWVLVQQKSNAALLIRIFGYYSNCAGFFELKNSKSGVYSIF
jgi:hypothetical protein